MKLSKYDKWLANWFKSNTKTPKHGMWQFGGSTNLIRSNKIAGFVVDQDYAYKDYPSIVKVKGLNGFRKNKYTKGEYVTLTALNVRTGPGVNYRQKLVKELTKDGVQNVVDKDKNAKAVYKKGTVFTALKIIKNTDNYWAKTPSGYVCLQFNNEVYCKKT